MKWDDPPSIWFDPAKKRPKTNPWNPPAPRARGATEEWNLQQTVANKSEKNIKSKSLKLELLACWVFWKKITYDIWIASMPDLLLTICHELLFATLPNLLSWISMFVFFKIHTWNVNSYSPTIMTSPLKSSIPQGKRSCKHQRFNGERLSFGGSKGLLSPLLIPQQRRLSWECKGPTPQCHGK